MYCIKENKNVQGVVTGFHSGEVVDLLKSISVCQSSGDCLFVSRSGTPPAWVWLFQKLWLLHGLPTKCQLKEASSVSPHWPAHTWHTYLGSIPGPVTLVESVSHICLQKLLSTMKNVILSSLSHYFSLLQVNMQRKAIFQLILEKRELLESQRFRRDGTEGHHMS